MAKQKYDWTDLKIKYLASDITEVLEFLRIELGDDKVTYTGNISKQTSGWRDEKEQMRAKSVEDSKDIIQEELTLSLADFRKGKNATLKKAIELVEKVNDPKSLRHLYNMFKIELGEPINISKNENSNLTLEELWKKMNDEGKDPYDVDDPSLDEENALE